MARCLNLNKPFQCPAPPRQGSCWTTCQKINISCWKIILLHAVINLVRREMPPRWKEVTMPWTDHKKKNVGIKLFNRLPELKITASQLNRQYPARMATWLAKHFKYSSSYWRVAYILILEQTAKSTPVNLGFCLIVKIQSWSQMENYTRFS